MRWVLIWLPRPGTAERETHSFNAGMRRDMSPLRKPIPPPGGVLGSYPYPTRAGRPA